MYKYLRQLLFVVILCSMLFMGCQEVWQAFDETIAQNGEETEENGYLQQNTVQKDQLYQLSYAGEPYVCVNDNQPLFTDKEKKMGEFEEYQELDELGRCQMAFANICKKTMPVEERGSISHIKPTGWQTVKYDIVEGKYLYNRCHLIGYQLSGENANRENLITGTRYMNVEGMLPFENMVADYVEEKGGHVLYRVTPVFQGDELLARGVTMEAFSLEDEGEGICFYVYVFNVQPGIIIDYSDGTSRKEKDSLK